MMKIAINSDFCQVIDVMPNKTEKGKNWTLEKRFKCYKWEWKDDEYKREKGGGGGRGGGGGGGGRGR